ncbi:MAG: TrmB family transcriptional regulator, partial [Candidatus Kariarchaeaceae archaeon]
MMLSQFGLSNYENKVYMKLLEMDGATAREISKASEVPYGRIYDVLHNLENIGILHKDNGRPQKFGAIEPETAISRLVEIKKQELTNITQEADLITQKLSQIYESKPRDKLIWKVAIGDELHKTYFNLLSEARREFLSYIDFPDDLEGPTEYLSEFQILVHEMGQRNVKIRLLIGVNNIETIEKLVEKYPEMIEILNSAEIKITSFLPYPFTVIDGHKVLLKVLDPSNPSDFLAAVYLWQDSLAKTLKQQFEKLWI